MHVAFWFVKRTLGWKNFMPENFLEINHCMYFSLMSYWNTIGQSNDAFSVLGFLWWENKEAMLWSYHPLADKTSNEHLPKPFFKVIQKSLNIHCTCKSWTLQSTMVPVIFSDSLANLSVKVIQQTIYKDDFWFNAARFHVFATLFWIVAPFFWSFLILQAFESFVCRCPKEVTPYIPNVCSYCWLR